MREKQIERKLTIAAKNMGGIAPKFTSPGFDGMPDRIVLLPGGYIAFVLEKTSLLNSLRETVLRPSDKDFARSRFL